MGKKYIIEIPEDKIEDFVGSTHFLMPYMMAGHIGHHDTGLPIKPYTEPDIEQVRKEAYYKGYHNGHSACYETAKDLMEKKKNEAYQRGLSDAWEAARKIGSNSTCSLKEMGFDFSQCAIPVYNSSWFVVKNYSASEAIEKIRQYEQEQEEFKVGDEFENGVGQKFVVLKMDGKEIDRYIDGDGKTYVMKEKYEVMRKTGRHFPEIAAVLEKMRGEQE